MLSDNSPRKSAPACTPAATATAQVAGGAARTHAHECTQQCKTIRHGCVACHHCVVLHSSAARGQQSKVQRILSTALLHSKHSQGTAVPPTCCVFKPDCYSLRLAPPSPAGEHNLLSNAQQAVKGAQGNAVRESLLLPLLLLPGTADGGRHHATDRLCWSASGSLPQQTPPVPA